MRVNETCGCGGGLSASSDDRAALAAILDDWRRSHPCPARDRAEREVVSGAQAEQAHTAPHRTDAELGFLPSPTVAQARELLGHEPAAPVPTPRPRLDLARLGLDGSELERSAAREQDDRSARR